MRQNITIDDIETKASHAAVPRAGCLECIRCVACPTHAIAFVFMFSPSPPLSAAPHATPSPSRSSSQIDNDICNHLSGGLAKDCKDLVADLPAIAKDIDKTWSVRLRGWWF